MCTKKKVSFIFHVYFNRILRKSQQDTKYYRTASIQDISCENIILKYNTAVLIQFKKQTLFFSQCRRQPRPQKADGSRRANTDKYRLSKINKTRSVHWCFVAINLFMTVMK